MDTSPMHQFQRDGWGWSPVGIARTPRAPSGNGAFTMSIRILLADDHQMMRQGLKSLLTEQPDFQVVGEAADGRTTVRLAQELSADVVIMDVTMPGLNGIDATRQLKADAPDVKVIGL